MSTLGRIEGEWMREDATQALRTVAEKSAWTDNKLKQPSFLKSRTGTDLKFLSVASSNRWLSCESFEASCPPTSPRLWRGKSALRPQSFS